MGPERRRRHLADVGLFLGNLAGQVGNLQADEDLGGRHAVSLINIDVLDERGQRRADLRPSQGM